MKGKFPVSQLLIPLVIVILILTLACMVNTTTWEIVSTSTPRPILPELPTNTPLPIVVEPGLAYGDPCTPPCWRDMTPGWTTSQEAAQAIERLEADGWATTILKASNGYTILPLPVSEGFISVLIEDDTVQEITGRTLFYYPVGDLIEQFGNPEGVYLWEKGRECSCKTWTPPKDPLARMRGYGAVDLLYPQQGLVFTIGVPSSGFGCICPEMSVDGFCY